MWFERQPHSYTNRLNWVKRWSIHYVGGKSHSQSRMMHYLLLCSFVLEVQLQSSQKQICWYWISSWKLFRKFLTSSKRMLFNFWNNVDWSFYFSCEKSVFKIWVASATAELFFVKCQNTYVPVRTSSICLKPWLIIEFNSEVLGGCFCIPNPRVTAV